MAMTLVETVTVGSGGAASIEFTGIAGTGKDLLILVSARGADAADIRGVRLQFNSDTGTNYNYLLLQGDGSSVSTSASGSFQIPVFFMTAATATANTFANGSIYISNYASSSAKNVSGDGVTENNTSTAYQQLSANNWTGTSAITSVKVYSSAGNFAQHSTASLYIIS